MGTFQAVFWSMWLFSVVLIYVVEERRGRARWRDVPTGEETPSLAGEVGLYRIAPPVPVMLRRAPRAVRLAALSSLVLGWMAIPGGLLGAFGLLAGGIGLVSIPGMIAAVKLFRSGLALLRRDTACALVRVENAVAWELWLNGIVGGISLLFATAVVAKQATDAVAVLAFLGVINLYGLVSVYQALFLRSVARRHTAALSREPDAELGAPLAFARAA